MTPSTSTPERQPPDKVTLFCPECGHESRINGDWLIQVLADSLVYECPNCGAVIDSRHTVDYNYVKIFHTPGCRNPSRDDSRQYQDQEVLAERSGGSLEFAAEN